MNQIILLIPHFNNPSGLKASLLSINETSPIDVLIVDDGSTEKLDLNELQEIYKFGKIAIEFLSVNQGIEKALNFGLDKIRSMNYTYIGRLDCGDFCKINKFSKQINSLEENPDVVLLGCWANVIDEKGNFLYELKPPTSYEKIKVKMYLNSAFVHPTVVFRSRIIDEIGYYPENYKYAEDYAYFFKIMKKYRIENYPEVLLDYVVSTESISSTKRKEQVMSRIKIIFDNFYFGFYPIYGLIRNSFLLLLSRNVANKIKQIISYRNKR
jgi:hypothetical protein